MNDNNGRSFQQDEGRKAYENIMNRSIHGSRSSSKPVEYVPRDKYNAVIEKAMLKIKRAFIVGLAVGVMSTATVGVVAPKVADELHEMKVVSQEFGDEISDFHKEVVNPNTFRVNNNKDYAYDYDAIAEALNSYGKGDFDRNVYICYKSMGSEQTSYVLDKVDGYKLSIDGESRSFRNYLNQHGMFPEGSDMNDDKAYDQAQDNFEELWENRVIIQDSIDEVEKKLNGKDAELNEMLETHNLDDSSKSNTKGGL